MNFDLILQVDLFLAHGAGSLWMWFWAINSDKRAVLSTCTERDENQLIFFTPPPPLSDCSLKMVVESSAVVHCMSFLSVAICSITLFFTDFILYLLCLCFCAFILSLSSPFPSLKLVFSSFSSLYPSSPPLFASLYHPVSLWTLNGCWLMLLCSRWSISPLFSSPQGNGGATAGDHDTCLWVHPPPLPMHALTDARTLSPPLSMYILCLLLILQFQLQQIPFKYQTSFISDFHSHIKIAWTDSVNAAGLLYYFCNTAVLKHYLCILNMCPRYIEWCK